MEGRIRYYFNEKCRYLTIEEKFRNKVAVVISRRGAVWKHMAGPVFQVACFVRWERIEFFHNILSGSAQKDQGLLNDLRSCFGTAVLSEILEQIRRNNRLG